MKHLILFLGLLTGSVKAELPQLAGAKEWLGYFVGWDMKGWDYGFGGDGKGAIFVKKRKDRLTRDKLQVRFLIQEHRKSKWISRSAIDWTTTDKKEENPKKPISALHEVKDGTKAEFLQTLSNGKIMVKAKLIEKTTKNPIRLAVEFKMRDLHRIKAKKAKDPKFNDKTLKKILKRDLIEAKRAKDGQRVSYKLYEHGIDILGTDLLQDGATELAIDLGYFKKTLTLEQGNPKVGKFEIVKINDKPLHLGYRILWIITPEEAEKKDAWMSFIMK